MNRHARRVQAHQERIEARTRKGIRDRLDTLALRFVIDKVKGRTPDYEQIGDRTRPEEVAAAVKHWSDLVVALQHIVDMELEDQKSAVLELIKRFSQQDINLACAALDQE